MAVMLRGVYPILVTPFDDHEEPDEESLRHLVDFTIAAGVHGLGIALGSEIQQLSEREREHVIRIVVDQTRGRVPVVVNSGTPASRTAALASRQAVDLGAAAVMCLPPTPASASETRAYFKAISEAVDVPVFIQDTQTTPVPAAQIRRIAEESEHVRYAKVESPPQPTHVQAAVDASQGLVTIFGGAGGGYFPEELRRGSQGTMPWPSQAETFVRIWDLWQAGDEHAAVELHERQIVPLARLSTAGIRLGHAVHKEILRRRGVIRSARVRSPADPLDPVTLRELDLLCDRLGLGTPVG